MSNDFAVKVENVAKVYKLYSNNFEMALDLVGLSRFSFNKNIKKFSALSNISFNIKQGERVGLIGRNGAGKSTLLKLICKNLTPTEGQISVNGNIQNLMDSGVGFHPDFTGLENIKASLNYNGLTKAETDLAIEEIVDFVELGDFLYQPLRTYSLGMKARLGFATATAIKPELLIIDEVLSAGDGYFASKCAQRIKNLTSNGSTLILVSHSNQQIIQFCERAIWLDKGQIRRDGDCLEVVKDYDRYLRDLEDKRIKLENSKIKSTYKISTIQKSMNNSVSVSQWPGKPGPKILQVKTYNGKNEEKVAFNYNDKIEFVMDIGSEFEGEFYYKAVIMIFSPDGKPLSLHCSEELNSHFETGTRVRFMLTYESILLGQGEYIFSAAIYKTLDPNDFSTAEIYDLLDRSFTFKVFSEYNTDPSQFKHPAFWSIT